MTFWFCVLNTEGKPVLQLLLLINFTRNFYLFTMMQNKADSVTALKIVPSLRLNSLCKKWGFLVLMTTLGFFQSLSSEAHLSEKSSLCPVTIFLSFLVWHILRKLFKLVPGCCFWLPCFSLPTLMFCWYGSFKVHGSAKHFLGGLLLHWRWLKRHLQVRKSIWCLAVSTTFKVMLTVYLT